VAIVALVVVVTIVALVVVVTIVALVVVVTIVALVVVVGRRGRGRLVDAVAVRGADRTGLKPAVPHHGT